MIDSRIWVAILLTLGTSVSWSQDQPAEEKTAQPPPSESTPAAPPPRTPTRDEYIAKPGAPREEIKSFREGKVLNFAEPKGSIDLYVRGEAIDNPKLVDDYAKFQAYRLTKANEFANKEILSFVDRARDGRGNVAQEFLNLYKPAVVKYLKELINPDIAVIAQANALIMMSEIQNGTSDTRDAVPVFIEVLSKTDLPDALHYRALEGLARAKRFGLVAADQEQQAAGLILKHLERSDLQSILKEKLLYSLGQLERAYDRIPADAAIATVLAEEAIDPNNTPRTREEAGRALARMNLQAVSEWNSQLQSQIIARVLHENLSANPEGVDQNRFAEAQRYSAALWTEAIKRAQAQAVNQSNADFNEICSDILLKKILVPILKREPYALNELQTWVEAHPLQNGLKLSPRARQIEQRALKTTPEQASEDADEKTAEGT